MTCNAENTQHPERIRCEQPADHDGAHSNDIYMWFTTSYADIVPARDEWVVGK